MTDRPIKTGEWMCASKANHLFWVRMGKTPICCPICGKPGAIWGGASSAVTLEAGVDR